MNKKNLYLLACALLGASISFASISTHASNTATALACGASKFMNVTADPKNSAYPAPSLTVTCDNTNMVVKSNGIPNFEFVRVNPNDLKAQNYTWNIPLTPTTGASRSVPLGGAVAVAVNGVPIFGPTEAPNDGYKDPYEQGILDYCNGHPAQRGDYHFHVNATCLTDKLKATTPGVVVGYAFDGWPILTPYVCADASCSSTKKLRSSWQLTSPSQTAAWSRNSYVAGAGDLDRCNGKVQADGSYAYYATDAFPYFIGCYIGDLSNSTGTTSATATPAATATPIATATPATAPNAALNKLTFLPILTK